MSVGSKAVGLSMAFVLAPLADENFRRALLSFEDGSPGFVLSQWIGTFPMLAVLFIVLEGTLRIRSNSLTNRATGGRWVRTEGETGD